MTRFAAAVVVAVLSAAGAALVAVAAGLGALLLVVAAGVAAAVASRKRLQPFLRSPVKLATATILAVGVGGLLVYGGGQKRPGSVLTVTPAHGWRTLLLFAVTAACLMIGAWLASRLTPSRTTAGIADLPAFSPRMRGWLWAAAAVPAVILLLSTPSQLLLRTQYLRGDAGSVLVGASSSFALAGVMLLGVLAATSKGPARIIAVLGAFLYWLALFSMGTRQLAMAPLAFAFAVHLGARSRRTAFGLVLGGLTAALLLPLALYLRGLHSHGFFPYTAALPGFFGSTLFGVLPTASNMLFGFAVASTTALASPPLPHHAILTSLNPLPGQWAGWYDISRQMRVNDFVPFSGVGEVGRAGWWAVAVTWLLIGAVLALLDRQVGRLTASGRSFLGLAILGCSTLFAVLVTTYNLRSASRYLWYAVAVAVLAELVRRRRAEDVQSPVESVSWR